MEAKFVNSKKWHNTILMLIRIQNRFSPSRELISDKAPEFNGKTAEEWHRKHGTRMLLITPYRPRGNSKIEQMNDVFKGIMSRISLIDPGFPLPDLLQTAVNTYNRTSRPSGYFSYFLFYGTTFFDRTSPEAYTRKSTREKKEIHERELV
jgi:transposase InsO family protein